MSSKDLDLGIVNLHKAIASLATADCVQLNVSKCITLHLIRLHFHDHIVCSAPLDVADITPLDADDICAMKADYTKSMLVNKTTGIGDVKVPKLTHLKWPEFKSALNKLFGRSFGQHEISFLYITREKDAGDFEDMYDDYRKKIIICTLNTGPAYKTDNGDVFSILVQNTETSEGSSIVQANERRPNGCKAWKELKKSL